MSGSVSRLACSSRPSRSISEGSFVAASCAAISSIRACAFCTKHAETARLSQTNHHSFRTDGIQHKYNMKAVVQIYDTTAELRQTTRRLCQRQSDGIRRSAGGGLCCATLNDRVRNLKMEWANSKMQRAACTATHNMHAQRTAPASTHAVQICTMWCRACSMLPCIMGSCYTAACCTQHEPYARSANDAQGADLRVRLCRRPQ